MSEPSGEFSTNFHVQGVIINSCMSLPAVSVHLLALGPFLIVSIPSFSLFNSKVVSPGLNPSTCSWSGTLKGCLVEDGREGDDRKDCCMCVCACVCMQTRWEPVPVCVSV